MRTRVCLKVSVFWTAGACSRHGYSGTVLSHNRQRRHVAKGAARPKADAKTGLSLGYPKTDQQAGPKTKQEQAPALQGVATFR